MNWTFLISNCNPKSRLQCDLRNFKSNTISRWKKIHRAFFSLVLVYYHYHVIRTYIYIIMIIKNKLFDNISRKFLAKLSEDIKKNCKILIFVYSCDFLTNCVKFVTSNFVFIKRIKRINPSITIGILQTNIFGLFHLMKLTYFVNTVPIYHSLQSTLYAK